MSEHDARARLFAAPHTHTRRAALKASFNRERRLLLSWRRGGFLMRTLVLNAGYEPLAVVSFRRALVLVLAGKATVVADGPNPVVSGSLILPRPSVILLVRYVRVPHA